MTPKEASKVIEGIVNSAPHNIDRRELEALDMAVKALEQVPDWTPVSDLPKESGDYPVTLKITEDCSCVDKLNYSLDLYSVNKYDFADKKRPGWYDYDSEWGYYEVNNVVAWMPAPKLYTPE